MTGTIWVVSILLFLSGLAAVVVRRQLLAMLLGLELMICAVHVILVHYSGLFGDPAGLAAVLLIMAAPSPAQRRWGAISLPKPLAAAGLLLPLADVLAVMSRAALPAPSRLAGALQPSQAALGSVLFGPYAVATEAVALLLFLSALALVESK